MRSRLEVRAKPRKPSPPTAINPASPLSTITAVGIPLVDTFATAAGGTAVEGGDITSSGRPGDPAGGWVPPEPSGGIIPLESVSGYSFSGSISSASSSGPKGAGSLAGSSGNSGGAGRRFEFEPGSGENGIVGLLELDAEPRPRSGFV